MKILKKILVALLLVLIVMQFFRPKKNQSDVVPATDFLAVTNPTPEVQSLVKNACYDCHSNHTRYPWYSEVAPFSYIIAEHIKDGKKHLNFSEWDNYSTKKKAHKLEEFVEEVEEAHMPLDSYTWLHKDAKLSQEQITKLTNWVKDVHFIYQLGDSQ
ncbi:heme-binding domain-containing protein [Ascidiimonas aurantiaca]|uniref:heme-binding domain-containing protein n=1 Tax=Ascidiimonas aurantiaca TaxID=1685432 RepID=UPI0030EBE874